jgi:hypothetical protein
MFRNTFLIVMIALSQSGHAQSPEAWLNSFFEKDLNIFFIVPKPSEEVKRIGERFQTALKNNQEWMFYYIEEHSHLEPGENLPYHKNMGITETEYHEFLTGMENTEVVEKGPYELVVRKNEFGLNLSIPTASFFPNIYFDYVGGGVETTFGYLEYLDRFESTGIVGPIKGYTWELTERFELGTPSGKNLHLSIGELTQSGDLLIELDVSVVKDFQMVTKFQVGLRSR